MAKRKKRKNCRPYPFDFKIRAVKLHIEEGLKSKLRPRKTRAIACQKWKEENGVITVEKRRKVLPDFSLVLDQN